MSNIAWMTRLDRIVVARREAEQALVEMVELGAFVALLAPSRCGRTTLLRGLKARLELQRPGALFLLLRPDQAADLPREVFLQDLLSKLKLQLVARGIRLASGTDDPYLELKNTLAALPTYASGPVVVAVDDLGRIDPKHLKTLLWVFRELHSMRADEGWNGPLGRLAVVVAGSRRLYELTVGGRDDQLSPFNIAELYYLPDLSPEEVESLVDRFQAEGLLKVADRPLTLAALQQWTGGHPALLKALLAEAVQQGGQLDPARVREAGLTATTHDRTLLQIWDRLLAEPAALDIARQIFMEGFRPPDNLEMAAEAVQIVYWLGAIVARNDQFEPRSQMIDVFLHQRFGALAGAGTTNGQADPPASATVTRFSTSVFPQGLLSGMAGGQGVLFVGAGASRAAGMPTWAELNDGMIQRILETARDDEERSHLDAYVRAEGPLAVAQLLRERVGLYEYHRFLRNTLRRPAPLAAVHRAMRKLPTSLIFTTNFDKLLERAFRLPDGDDPPVIVSTPQLAAIQEQAGPVVIKLHGDIDQPETIVLTADDYHGYFERHRAMRAFLEHQLSYRTVLFIGFGLKDPNFDLIFEEARRVLAGSGRPAYAVMVGTNPIEVSRWKARGIHIIEIETYDDIPRYLEELAHRLQARP